MIPELETAYIKSSLAFYRNAVFVASALVLLASCTLARAEVYDSETIADAIYQAEGGAKTIHPYGVLSISCHGEAQCRAICVRTIENTFTRWQADGSQGGFLEALSARYAPIGASNDSQHLNEHWLGNVRAILYKNK